MTVISEQYLVNSKTSEKASFDVDYSLFTNNYSLKIRRHK